MNCGVSKEFLGFFVDLEYSLEVEIIANNQNFVIVDIDKVTPVELNSFNVFWNLENFQPSWT